MCKKRLMFVMVVLCLAAASAPAVADLAAGKVLHLNLDGNILDQSGNGYSQGDGQLVGDAHYVAGKYGQALDFDGWQDFIQVMVEPDGLGGWAGQFVNGQKAVTYAMWVKMDAYPTGEAGLLSGRTWWNAGETNLEFHPFFGLDKVYLINQQGAVPGENPVAAIPSASLGEWIHIAATYDAVAGQALIYFNGVVAGQSFVDPSRVVDIGNFTLGGNALYGRWFDGQIDELYIYDRALNVDEVNALMIPEPATMTLLAIGMSTVLIRRRRSN